MPFVLDPRLAADTLLLGHFAVSRVLLMNDRQFPWLILVPARQGASELFDLAEVDRQQLMDEISASAAVLAETTQPTKINVAALGNIVRQLHVHIVARFEGDPAWPGPVWGRLPPVPYAADEATRWRERLLSALAKTHTPFQRADD